MKDERVRTLIIGSGFSGRTVASWLSDDDYLIVERGEQRTHAEMAQRYRAHKSPDKPFWENARHAYRSDLPFNRTYDLSGRGKPTCFSQFEFIGGGTSNRWDGHAVRIPSYIFSSREYLSWPISYTEITPWYELAERQLNVCGDYVKDNLGRPPTRINSGDYFRGIFGPLGFDVYIRNQAKNPIRSVGKQGICVGAGSCEICPNDAKVRPDHLYPDQTIRYGTLVREVVFQGGRATSIVCENESGATTVVGFDRLVIAAHAVESAKLLARCPTLPTSVRRAKIGRYFQDHAQCDLRVLLPGALDRRRSPFVTNLEITQLTGLFEGIDVRVAVTAAVRLWEAGWGALEDLKPRSMQELHDLVGRIIGVSITFEMPPKLDSYVDFSGESPVVRDDSWAANLQKYERINALILKRLESSGIKVLETRPHYRHNFGQHHLVGTLNMSDGAEAVVDSNFKVIGTDNVFVAGTAVIPRLGAPNPTLTAVALANKLGASLKAAD